MRIARIQRSKEKAREKYDRNSRWYDLTEGLFETYYRKQGLKLLNPQPNDRILEIGVGTGSAITQIGSNFTTGHITGIDISSKMLDKTRRRIKRKNIEHLVTLINDDFLSYSKFAENQFDKIFMSFTLELFTLEEIKLVLNRCGDLLKPDGKLVIVALDKLSDNHMGSKIYEYLHFMFPIEMDCRPIPVVKILQNLNYRLIRGKRFSMWGIPIIVCKCGYLSK